CSDRHRSASWANPDSGRDRSGRPASVQARRLVPMDPSRSGCGLASVGGRAVGRGTGPRRSGGSAASVGGRSGGGRSGPRGAVAASSAGDDGSQSTGAGAGSSAGADGPQSIGAGAGSSAGDDGPQSLGMSAGIGFGIVTTSPELSLGRLGYGTGMGLGAAGVT